MGKKVLVIEDDSDIRDLVKRCLKKDSHEVHESWSGEEGLEKLAELIPDVVILDLGLPGINGIDVCKQMRANPAFAQVKVIVLTSDDKPSVMQACKQAGADEFITKPFEPRQIRDLVNR